MWDLGFGIWDLGRKKPMRVCVLALVVMTAAGYAQERTSDGSTRADWPHYGGTVRSWRYSALDQINTTNVRNLTPAWIFQTGEYANGLLSTPIVVDGVMYVSTPRSQVFALDAATGRVLWNYKHTLRPNFGLAGSMTVAHEQERVDIRSRPRDR
jgi:alcohol dehydrogenase (cytochrome c)